MCSAWSRPLVIEASPPAARKSERNCICAAVGRPRIGFQLKSECAAVVQQDQVSHARADTKAAEDRGLYGTAPAAVRDVKPNEAGHPARAKMCDDSTLNKLLGADAAAHDAAPIFATRQLTPSGDVIGVQCRLRISSHSMTPAGPEMCEARSPERPSQAVDLPSLFLSFRNGAGYLDRPAHFLARKADCLQPSPQ